MGGFHDRLPNTLPRPHSMIFTWEVGRVLPHMFALYLDIRRPDLLSARAQTMHTNGRYRETGSEEDNGPPTLAGSLKIVNTPQVSHAAARNYAMVPKDHGYNSHSCDDSRPAFT